MTTGTNGVGELDVLVRKFETGMAKFWNLRKEFSLCRFVVFDNDSLLLLGKLEQFAFLLSRESLESFSSGINLIVQDG